MHYDASERSLSCHLHLRYGTTTFTYHLEKCICNHSSEAPSRYRRPSNRSSCICEFPYNLSSQCLGLFGLPLAQCSCSWVQFLVPASLGSGQATYLQLSAYVHSNQVPDALLCLSGQRR